MGIDLGLSLQRVREKTADSGQVRRDRKLSVSQERGDGPPFPAECEFSFYHQKEGGGKSIRMIT